VALELPAWARSDLLSWLEEGLGEEGRGGLRLIRPEDLHVTLCFLGWRLMGEAAAIASACGAAVAGEGVAALAVERAIWLPPRRPRVLAVELRDVGGVLARVQASLSQALEAGGWYTPEKRPFLAHVTVARVGGARQGRFRAPDLPSPPGLRFEASRVTLYRSRLSAAGARYEGLETVALGGSA
jgi:2'-5' RNA ligase